MKTHLKDNRNSLTAQEAGIALAQMVEENLDMKAWKFVPSVKKFLTPGNLEIIYDSEWCRTKFIYSREQPNLPLYDELRVYYGRKHAPDNGDFIDWQGELCWCWHDIFDTLWFLDGISPLDAVLYEKKKGPLPPVVNEFWDSPIGINLRNEFPPHFTLACQAMLWKHYKQNIFKLFDIREPNLWNQYKKFLEEFHKLKGTKTYFRQPPKSKIC